jgi:hypothetical protein
MPSLLQTASKNAGAVGSSTLAFPSNVTSGSLLVVYITINAATGTLSASDNVNGNYNVDVTAQGQNNTGAICTFPGAAGGATTVTFSQSGAAGGLTCVIEEWSGIVPSTALDQIASVAYTSTSTPSSGSTPTTTQAYELLLGAVVMNIAQTVTPGTGWSLGRIQGRIAVENQVVIATGAYAATFTLGASATGDCLISTYKCAGLPPILMGGMSL